MPYYDFACDGCGSVQELRRPMVQAGDPASCPECGAALRRLYDTLGTAVIMRPWGFSLKPGDPAYWDGFDAPTPAQTEWRKSARGRVVKALPERSPQFVGVGAPHNS